MRDSLLGVRIYETKALPEGTVLFFNARAVADRLRFDRGKIELEPMDRSDLMKLVLGPRPDWIKPET